MIVRGRCTRKTVGFTLDKYYTFKKVSDTPELPEDENISDYEVDYYVANDRGRLMAITERYFDKYFVLTDVEV